MKKLLFFFMLLPVFCLAQTNTTPQFKRNIPADSLIGYSIPGVTGNHWLPDTAWVKKHAGVSGSFLPLTFTSNQTVTQNGFAVLFRAVASGDSSAVVNTPVGFGAATYALSFGTNGFLTTKTTGAAMGANLSGSNRALHINTTGGFYQDSIGHKGIDYGAEIDSTTWGDRTLITRRFFFDHLPSEGDSNLGNSDLTQSDPTRTFTIGTGVLNFIAKNGSDSTAVSVAGNSFVADSYDFADNANTNIQVNGISGAFNSANLVTNNIASVGTNTDIAFLQVKRDTDNATKGVSASSQGVNSPGVVVTDGIDHNGLVGDELFTVSGDPNQYVQFGNAPSGGGNTIYSADDSIHNTDRQVSLNHLFLGFLGTTNSDFNVQLNDPVNHVGLENDNVPSGWFVEVQDTTNGTLANVSAGTNSVQNATNDAVSQANITTESLGNQSFIDLRIADASGTPTKAIHMETVASGYQKGIVATDGIDEIGYRYGAANYGTNGKNYNEWVPDWGTVKLAIDSAFTAGAGNIYTIDGQVTPGETRTVHVDSATLQIVGVAPSGNIIGFSVDTVSVSFSATNGSSGADALFKAVPSNSGTVEAEMQVRDGGGAEMSLDMFTGGFGILAHTTNGLGIQYSTTADYQNADGTTLVPKRSVDSIAIAKADSVGATIGGASVSFHPNVAGDVISTLVIGPTLTPTLIINNNVNLTGNPTTTTQTSGNSSTRIATTAFVAAAISGVTVPTAANPTASAGTTAVNGSATTFMRSDGAPKVDSAAFTTKALIGTYLTKSQVVTTYAPLASPTLTGTPTAPTATLGTNTTQLATTAFVLANAGSTTFANPTASIGVTAVNGSATTAMRSDAAPKADTSVLRTVANSYSLSGMQTKVNAYLPKASNLSGLTNIPLSRSTLGLGYSTPYQIRNNYLAAWWGDSLTAGQEGWAIPAPSLFATRSGFNVFNGGINGQTSTLIYARFTADTAREHYATIINWGRNDLGDTTTLKANWNSFKTLMTSISNSRYVVVGIIKQRLSTEYTGTTTSNTIDRMNSYASTLFGSRFVDIEPILVAAYNPAIPQDVIDHGHGVPPLSLHAVNDSLHLNTAGYQIVANNIPIGQLLDTTVVVSNQTVRGVTQNNSHYDVANNGEYDIAGAQMLWIPTQETTFIGTAYVANLTNTPRVLSHSSGVQGQENLFGGWMGGNAATTAFAVTTWGAQAGQSVTSGNSLTFVGTMAGVNATSATGITAIGTSAGGGITTGTNDLVLGNGMNGLSSSLSNRIILGVNGVQSINITGNATPSANQVLRTGDSGGAADFGALTSADIPALSRLTLTANASPTYAAGSIVYDSSQSGNSVFTAYGNDSNVGLQIGQEEWLFVSNATGSTIPNGSAVYISGSSSGVPTIALAQANASTTTIGVGLTTESIANGATGYVTTIGVVHGLNTSSFVVGPIYISAATPGALTQTAPSSPNYRYRIGFVTAVDASVGQIQVTPSTASLGNGTANQLFGMNNAGTAQETKTITVNQGLTVTGATPGILQLGMANITPGTINTTHLPANIFQTPIGTAGTDSVLVKIGSTGKLGAISPTYYAPIASPTFTGSAVFASINPVTIGNAATNLWQGNSITSTSSTTAIDLIGGAGTVYAREFLGNGQTNTTMVTAGSASTVEVAQAPITTFSSGTSAIIAGLSVRPPAITISGSAVVTNAATVYSQGVPAAAAAAKWNGWFNGGISRVSGLQLDTLTASKVVFTDANKRLTSTGIGTSGQYIAGDGSLVNANTGLITGTPTIVAGTGAGTGPTVSVTTNGKQLQVTVTTGTLPTGTNATIATVTLPNALTYTPLPVFSSANAATALLSGASMIFMTSTGTANVTITSGTTALTAATTYVWNVTL